MLSMLRIGQNAGSVGLSLLQVLVDWHSVVDCHLKFFLQLLKLRCWSWRLNSVCFPSFLECSFVLIKYVSLVLRRRPVDHGVLIVDLDELAEATQGAF